MAAESGFRSERMELVQILMQKDCAHDTVDELARLGCVQFKDSDDNKDRTAFQREYALEVRLCDEILRKVRFIKESAKKLEVEVEPAQDLEGLGEVSLNLTELSTELGDAEKELKDMFARQRFMDMSAAELLEHEHLLKNIPKLVGERSEIRPPSVRRAEMGTGEEQASLVEQGQQGGVDQTALRMIAGLVDVDKKEALSRVVYRISRGNALVKYATDTKIFVDSQSGDQYERDCFIIMFSGNVLQDKIGKLLSTFGATRFAVPDSADDLRTRLQEVSSKVGDHQQVKAQATKQKRLLIGKYTETIAQTELVVVREKQVHAAMNLFNCRISNRTLLGEAWVPKDRLKDVEAAMRRGVMRAGGDTPSVLSVIHTHEAPPTYIKTNKLTGTFQSLNDAYGVPRYMELNPGIFYVVTYSFLFGIMFGDIGHGTLMLLGALFLVINEKKFEGKKLNDLVEPAYAGRYVLLLMSVFSIYCGAVYNECFGIALIPFSYYSMDCPEGGGVNGTEAKCSVEPVAPPPFGVDPIWSISENKLGFNNSFKMKISIIIGVAQMCFGLACKTSNCLYFKQWKELYFENIPEFLFLLSIFGYLAFLIVLKWCTDWVGLGLAAPALLDTLLKMLLECGSPIAQEDLLYAGQATVQPCLVALAFICVPWMLLIKPYVLKAEHKGGYKELTAEDHSKGGGHGDDHGGDFDFQETMIHQSIHTIEFVLGSVSNTASYLRLWALSLAHAGLSEVFWERAMLSALEAQLSPPLHALGIFCAFSVWACLTFGVLMVMETLSACLHDIRLHWVEFQNKFYHGDGYAFVPLSFEQTLGDEED